MAGIDVGVCQRDTHFRWGNSTALGRSKEGGKRLCFLCGPKSCVHFTRIFFLFGDGQGVSEGWNPLCSAQGPFPCLQYSQLDGRTHRKGCRHTERGAGTYPEMPSPCSSQPPPLSCFLFPGGICQCCFKLKVIPPEKCLF